MALLEIKAARREFVTPEGGRLAALDGVDLAVDADDEVVGEGEGAGHEGGANGTKGGAWVHARTHRLMG